MVIDGASRVDTAIKQLQRAGALRELGQLIVSWDVACKRQAVRRLQCVRSMSSVHSTRQHKPMRRMIMALRRQESAQIIEIVQYWAQQAGYARAGQSANDCNVKGDETGKSA